MAVELFQKTIAGPVHIEGRGLHLGFPCKLRLFPAVADAGLFFVSKEGLECRVGLDALEVRPLRTAMVKEGFSVETIEHLLAAINGLGITNLRIEIDGPEPPACDGSALVFAQKILEVGIVDQEAPRNVYKVDEAVVVHTESGGQITALPYANGLKVTYVLSGDGLPSQVLEYEHSTENFLRVVAGARTFCREFEVEVLKATPGIGDGADENNTLVVSLKDIEQKQRIPNELAAHKILDLLGDLSLFGRGIHAHLICHRSGHACNHDLLRALRRKSGAFALNINIIKEMLPHAYPFLLVDRILDYEENKRVVGLKNVTVNEPFFPGHFPDEPIMPGVLLIEALAQTGAVFIYRNQNVKEKKLVLFTGVDKVKFRHRVVPGDQVILEVEAKNLKSHMGIVRAVARVGGMMACEAELKFMIVEKS
jgi:UDP-3-O-[3-hydroxymyristoyl] N-acetylglucosamine deacetylase / 3-hydroxyacyl-[acyl-carrier-protein] dehydratase